MAPRSRNAFGQRLDSLLGVGAVSRFAAATGHSRRAVTDWIATDGTPPAWAHLVLDMLGILDAADLDRPDGLHHRRRAGYVSRKELDATEAGAVTGTVTDQVTD